MAESSDVLAAIPSPAGLSRWLSQTDAQEAIFDQQIVVNAQWWSTELAAQALPADAVTKNRLSRTDVFALAEGAKSEPREAERLLWNAIAWGAGNRRRLVRKRIESYAADRTAFGDLLCRAAGASSSDPIEAFRLLRPKSNAIKYLGPAFFTKYLYFAGGGRPDHPCCILDDRVAASLQAAGWSSLSRGSNWHPATYGQFIDLMHRWAAETKASRLDLIERYLFDGKGTL